MAAVDVLLPAPEDGLFAGEVRVLRRRHASADNGFAVLEVATTDGTMDLVITGLGLAMFAPDDVARVQGKWDIHSVYGRQVKVAVAEHVDPSEHGEQLQVLLTLPGVGRATAGKLLADHGLELFARLDADPEGVLEQLPQFGTKRAAKAADAWRKGRGDRGLFLLLAPHGLARLVTPLSERHKSGPAAVAAIRANPYALVSERGVGFDTAERIARDFGVRGDSPERAEAALLQALSDGEGNGHTFLPLNELLRRASALAGPVSPERVGALEMRKRLMFDGARAWRASTYKREETVCGRLAALLTAAPRRPFTLPRSTPAGVSPEQWTAVRRCFDHGVSVLVGGPGTGKTTSVRTVVAMARAAGFSVELAAPTGRAARRLEQATGHSAQTVHRLLGWKHDRCAFHEGAPLDCDLLVLDEASMCDLEMTAKLLAAAPDGCRLLIVGDSDQLPSVRAGRVLADLLESGRVPVTHLTSVFRQAARSQIVQAAHAVNRGELPELGRPSDPNTVRDFFFIEERNAARLGPLVCDLVAHRLPDHYDVDPLRDITVLAPAKQGPAGVVRLNELLRQRLNPDREPVVAGVRVGDKVMWTVNDPERDLMNGMTLTVEDADRGAKLLHCRDEDDRLVAIRFDEARNLTPAMAITAHKSQGCEVPIAVVVLHRAGTHPALLCRPLVYTAITRAREIAVVVGDSRALADAVAREVGERRYSALAERLAASLPR